MTNQRRYLNKSGGSKQKQTTALHQGWKWAFKKLCCCVGGRVELCQFRPVSFSPRVTSTRVNFKFDPLPYILLEELLSNTRLNFLYFLVFLLSGISPVLILFTTVQLISFDTVLLCYILWLKYAVHQLIKVTPRTTLLSCQSSYIAIATFQPANQVRVRATVPAY